LTNISYLKFKEIILFFFIILEASNYINFFTTTIYFLIIYTLIILLGLNFIKNYQIIYSFSKPFKLIYILSLLYFSFHFVLGYFLSENYWDLKWIFYVYLPWVTCFALILLSNVIVEKSYDLLKFFYLIVLCSLIIFLFFNNDQIFQRFLSWIYIPILFFKYLKPRDRLIIISISLMLVILFYNDWRVNIIRIIFSYLVIFVIYTKIISSKRFIFLLCNTLILLPFLYLFFKTYSNLDLFDFFLTSDSNLPLENTRSFLIEEILAEMKNNNVSFIFGGSPSQSFYSPLFVTDDNFITGNFNRQAAETGFMTLLLKTGIIGIFLLYMITYYSVKNLLNNNNQISLILALSISFNWLLFFIALPIKMNLSNALFFLLIGLSFSKFIKNLK